MFVLSVIEDEVALHPSQFGPGKHISTIRSMIEAKYIDRVIPDVGLAVSLYDILEVRDAYIFPGDLKDSQGDAACTVRFRLVVFRPKVNDILIGKVHSSTPMGLQVTLGFFQDCSIPSSQLRRPCAYDERLKLWAWQYSTDGGQSVNYPYKVGEPICVKVKSVQFSESVDSAVSGSRRAEATQKKSPRKIPEGHHPTTVTDEPPMLVVGSVEEDGMGLLSWWL
jgi:DNA-directed RNA polymerase III subunit RPC8